MERPKVTAKPIKRQVTGEIVHLDMMRQEGQFPSPYGELSDMAIQMHEASAALYESMGVRPAIMDEYEQYDTRFDDVYLSCVALTKELLELRGPNPEVTFVDIAVDTPAAEVLAKLHESLLARVLNADDAQLAIESDGSYYPVLDIKKQDATLRNVGLTVWGWKDNRKYIMTDNKRARALVYPQDEQSEWFQIDVVFGYSHPQAKWFSENMTLSIGTQGDMRLSSGVSVPEYAETGYEGHGYRALSDQTDEDILHFADVVAEIVGDEPMTTRQRREREFEKFLNKVVLSESVEYLREWIDNSWIEQVLGDLTYVRCGDMSIVKALITPEFAAQAHELLTVEVDKRRSSQNERASDAETVAYFGRTNPWIDRVIR